MATILVVDDRLTNRELTVTLLGYAGHRVLEAAEGEAGLAIARAEHPDLIITDIVMPTMDGYEFARQVRADPSINNTQIIFHTSSYIVAETRRLAEACGVSIVLGKPIEPEYFLNKVSEALATQPIPTVPPVSENFHQEHMRLLTDTLAKKVDELESEIVERRHAEERLRLVVESAPNAILAVNREGLIEMVNSQAEKFFGYDRAELIGLSVDALVPEQSRGIHLSQRLSYLKEIETRPMGIGRDLYAVRKDGTEFPVEIGLTPITTAEGLLVIATVVDITQRKQAEESIALQNQRLRVLREIDLAILAADSTEEIITAALNHTRELIACRRASLVLIDWGTNEAEIFAISTLNEPTLPPGSRLPLAHFKDVIPTLSQNQLIVFSDLRLLADPNPSIQLLLKAGSLSTCSLPLFSQGTLIGMFSMHSEIPGFFDEEKIALGQEVANQVAIAITQRRLLEGLREGEEKYRAFFLNSMDAIMLTSPDGSIQSANPAASKMLGRTEAEICALGRSGLIDMNDPRLNPLLEERARTGKSVGELTMFRHDGSPFPVEMSSALFQDRQGNTRSSMIIRDITERKQAEEELHKSEKKFSDAFHSSPAAMTITRIADGTFVDANTEFLNMFEFSRDEVLGHTSIELKILGPEARRLLIERQLATGGLQNAELETRSNSGKPITLLFSSSPIDINDEAHHITTMIEITERKQAEETLQAKNEELKAMSQQLWQAAKLATMGELAASIAHELNNPLATVSLRAEMLQAQFGPDDPQSKSLHIIDSEVKRMSSLVMNLLQFSRRSASQTSTINVNDEVANSLELVQYHLRKNSVLTVQELSPEILLVQADRQQLRQVFLNLFTNAVDAMPLGGMLTIRSWTGEKPDAGITAPLRPSTNESLGLPTPDLPQVFIEVSDTGEGIEADNLERVWEPFFTTKPEGKGTGLGLAICRRIIQEHGGTIKVLSDGIPGKGTTIQLTLPAQKER